MLLKHQVWQRGEVQDSVVWQEDLLNEHSMNDENESEEQFLIDYKEASKKHMQTHLAALFSSRICILQSLFSRTKTTMCLHSHG